MNINCFIGELLYIGTSAEKGRCSTSGWPIGYKRVLKIHLSELKKTANLYTDSANAKQVLERFRRICNNKRSIGKYYDSVDWDGFPFSEEINNSYPQIVNYICQLLDTALLELGKIRTDKRKVSKILRCLHNLPRVFLSENEGVHKQMRASEKDVIAYMLQNADDDIKNLLGINLQTEGKMQYDLQK